MFNGSWEQSPPGAKAIVGEKHPLTSQVVLDLPIWGGERRPWADGWGCIAIGFNRPGIDPSVVTLAVPLVDPMS